MKSYAQIIINISFLLMLDYLEEYNHVNIM